MPSSTSFSLKRIESGERLKEETGSYSGVATGNLIMMLAVINTSTWREAIQCHVAKSKTTGAPNSGARQTATVKKPIRSLLGCYSAKVDFSIQN